MTVARERGCHVQRMLASLPTRSSARKGARHTGICRALRASRLLQREAHVPTPAQFRPSPRHVVRACGFVGVRRVGSFHESVPVQSGQLGLNGSDGWSPGRQSGQEAVGAPWSRAA